MALMRNRFFQSIMALGIAYLAIVFFISQSSAGDSKAISEKLIEMSPDNRLDLLIQITGVNPLEGTAQARVLPWPQSDDIGYQFKSGWIPSQNISIHVDSVIGASNGGTSVYDFEKEVPTGGFNVQIDEQPGAGTRSKVSWYPLDLYNFEVPISVVGEESSLNILPQDYTKNIDTFDIRMTHGLWSDPIKTVTMADEKSFDLAVDEFTNGQSSTIFTATRSNSTKLLVAIILLLMVTAMTSVAILTHMVVDGKRPPSLSSLTWTAALTYSLISLRGLMPGDPPIGIFVDKIFYFPSLILTLICSLWVLVTWVRRDDFQA